jgi:hypothetical protein
MAYRPSAASRRAWMTWAAAGPGLPRAGRPARAGVQEQFIAFLDYGIEIRRLICSTDERPVAQSHPQPRPVPSGQAVLKVLYLAVRNLAEYRRPSVGIRSSGWK